jgi:hypothetical protein
MINNKLKLLMIVFAIMSSTMAAAQKKPSRKCECGFSTINQGGFFIAGEQAPGGIFQTINGFRFREWFAGAGVGIDFYRFRTIPVFLDIRRNILLKQHSPFLYADIGINFPWLRGFETPSYYEGQDFKGRLYFDTGLGYNFNISGKHRLLLSAGYTEKRIREKRTVQTYCINPPCSEKFELYNYTMKRIVFKIGWSL